MYLILNISLLGSTFYILFKITEKFLKNDLSCNFYYKFSKIIALMFILPLGYIMSLVLPDFTTNNFQIINNKNENISILNNIQETERKIKFSEGTLTKDILNLIEDKTENISVENSHQVTIQKNNYISSLKENPLNIDYNLIFKVIYILGFMLFCFVNLLFFIRFKFIMNKSKIISNEDYLLILCKVKEKFNIKRNILLFENEVVSTPMLIGIFKPKIIFPKKEIQNSDLEFIITHELIHYKRKDLITKLILLFINSINFFNPLIYFLIKDIDKWCEYSCDERLIKSFDLDNRKNYCMAILNSLNPIKNNNIYFSTTFACNKQNLKRRFENIMLKNKSHNKFKILVVGTLFTIISMVGITTFGMNYSKNSNSEIEIQNKNSNNRKFEDKFYIKPNRVISNGKALYLSKEFPADMKKEYLKPKVRLKGTFIKEEPSKGDFVETFSVSSLVTDSYYTMSNYVKIDLENIAQHKDDTNNQLDLYCDIYGYYYNEETLNTTKVYLDTFSVSKNLENNKKIFVFETVPQIKNYELRLYHMGNKPPAFKLNVVSSYKLEDLGVKEVSNQQKEESLPINKLNTFDIGVGNYNNLNLKIENESEDEYVLILEDNSADIKNTLAKEFIIKPNTTFEENISNVNLKTYIVNLIPSVLKDDFLKIQQLEREIYIENENLDKKTLSEKEKQLKILRDEYHKKYKEIKSRNKGTIYYNLTK